MIQPVILVTCFDMDNPGDWFLPRWALLTQEPTMPSKKARLITWHGGGIRVIDEYHFDYRQSAHFWIYLSEVHKLRNDFTSGFRADDKAAELHKMLACLPDLDNCICCGQPSAGMDDFGMCPECQTGWSDVD